MRSLHTRAFTAHRTRTCAAALLALLAGHAAHAQIAWLNSGGGSWSNASNWDASNIPDNTGESALIGLVNPFTVQFDASRNIGSLFIPNALATLDILNNQQLALTGGIDSAGLIRVNNTAGPNNTLIRLLDSQTWSGTGKVTLNANGGNLDTAYIIQNAGPEILTLASEKQINGTGNIYVGMINNGGVYADVPGRVLQLWSASKVNNAEMGATNGGALRVQGITLNQSPAAALHAYTGSTVAIESSTVVSGKIISDLGGAVQITGNTVFDAVTTSGFVDVINNSELRLLNSLLNTGDIRVNSGVGPNTTLIRLLNNVALEGNGFITLRSTSNLDTAYINGNTGTEVLTQGPDHTIRGAGNIYAGLINNGLVSATTPGLTLRLLAATKTNNKTLRAETGRLQIESTTINQGPSGTIVLADNPGAQCVLLNCTINAGQLLSSANIFSVNGTTVLNNTAINGPMRVENASELRLSGSGTNHTGDLFVNTGSGPNNTDILLLNNHILSGPGRIILRATSNLDTAYIIYNGGSELLTQQASHSIVGTGGIYVALDNAGLVSADQPGKVLDLKGAAKTNSGVMNAVNSGILRLNAVSLTQTGAGVLRADNAGLVASNSNITGGLIETINAGTFDILGTTTLSTLTLKGTARVPNANELRFSGGTITNNAVLTINPSAGPNNTLIRAMTNQTILGNGQIVLNANPGNLDTAYLYFNAGPEVLTNSATHTIRGIGRIYVNLTNNGQVVADVPGRTLELVGAPKLNNAEMWARNGGNLQFSAIGVSQTPNAAIRSESGSSITVSNSVLSGGVMQTASDTLADAASFVGVSTISDIELVGAAKIPNSSELRLTSPGIINNAVITVNPTAGPNGTLIRAAASTTVEGSGTILLNANPGNFDTAYLYFNAGPEVLTLGSQHSLAGNGRVYVRVQNNGTLSPGNPVGNQIGRIELVSQPFSQTATGVMRFEISGPSPSQFDRVTGGAALNLNGTLNLALTNAYAPSLGTTFDVIDGPVINGTFAAISPGFAVQYFPNKVRVTVTGATCPGDLNRDGLIDDADFLIFTAAYDLVLCSDPAMPQFCPSDLNRDTFVDDLDFQIFAVAYANVLCP